MKRRIRSLVALGLALSALSAGATAMPQWERMLSGRVWSASGKEPDMHLGRSLSIAGDVNGDGFDDLVKTGPGFHGHGVVLLHPGSPSGPSAAPTWIVEGEQKGEGFGTAVAIVGDVNADGFDDVLVGAPYHDEWRPAAASGRTAFVGALKQEIPRLPKDLGRVALYLGSADGLELTPAWTLVGIGDSHFVGAAVAAAGDVNGDGFDDVLIGAPGAFGTGAAFLIHGRASGLRDAPAWVVTGSDPGSQFGSALVGGRDLNNDGDLDAAVGAPFMDAGFTDSGAAYVYLGASGELSTSPHRVLAGSQPLARYGTALAMGEFEGNGYADLLVGVPGQNGGQIDEGRLDFYSGAPWGVDPVASWTAEVDVAGTGLGSAVAMGDLDGDGLDELIVGAGAEESLYAGAEAGSIYVYRGGPGPATTPDRHIPGGQAGARLGDVLSAGDVNGDGLGDLAVGIPLQDGADPDDGEVRVYTSEPASFLETNASWKHVLKTDGSESPGAFYGNVAYAGDVNGDGFDDVLTSAPSWRPAPFGGENDLRGRAVLFHGPVVGVVTPGDWDVPGDVPGCRFGSSIDGAGDVNGDGYADIVVGAHRYYGGISRQGKAYLFTGSASGLATVPDWTVTGGFDSAYMGQDVAGAGDVNGDGYADVIVGASGMPRATPDNGVAMLFHGSPTGLAATADTTLFESDELTTSEGNYGDHVAAAGDVNSDGYDDVLVAGTRFGSPYYAGEVFLYLGSAGGVSTAPAWSADGNQLVNYFGSGLACAGDVNADGYVDVVVGAYGYEGSETQTFEGGAFVYLGGPMGLSKDPVTIVESERGGAQFGTSVSAAGDVNADGFADVLIGANRFRYQEYSENAQGAAFVHLGGPGGIAPTPIWIGIGATAYGQNEEFGSSVGGGGDGNGDGLPDMLVGGPGYDAQGSTGNGRVYLFHGEVR